MADRRNHDELAGVPAPAPPPLHKIRSHGALSLRFARRGAGTAMLEARQAGCLRVRLPRVARGERFCAVTLNTAGGLTGGDTIANAIRWDEGAVATVTSQAAEKIYRAHHGAARIETRMQVESAALAEWLPQETILFNRARLDRRTNVRLAQGARFLAVEALVFGRAAMGETIESGGVRDAWRIFRDGKLIYADVFALAGAIHERLGRAAIAHGARAVALIVYAGEDASAVLPALRAALETARGRAAASAWNGLLVVRLLAPDSETLREDVTLALDILRGGSPPPRAWAC